MLLLVKCFFLINFCASRQSFSLLSLFLCRCLPIVMKHNKILSAGLPHTYPPSIPLYDGREALLSITSQTVALWPRNSQLLNHLVQFQNQGQTQNAAAFSGHEFIHSGKRKQATKSTQLPGSQSCKV